MSHLSESLPTSHSRHVSMAAVVALLVLYFLTPWFLVWPVWKAKEKGYISLACADWVHGTFFAPIGWLSLRSGTYSHFLRAEEKLCERLFGELR